MAGRKYLKNNAGTITEELSVDASVGAGDAGKIVALDGDGVLDPTIVNSTTASLGAGSSGKVVALDGAGRIDSSMMPVGFGDDVTTIQASENLNSGDFVNIFNSAGNTRVRKADASVSGKEAHGFVLNSVTAGQNATVYFEGANTAVAGQTAGVVFLSTTPGLAGSAAPAGAGNVVQRIGFAVGATEINFDAGDPIVLA